jgi:hypothetical protein
MPLGRRLQVHVVTGEALGPGVHSLEAELTPHQAPRPTG